jgi:PleD family two-component response regulator
VTASIGIAAGIHDDALELLRRADTALYSAKRSGRSCYRVYRPGEPVSQL